MAIPIILDCYTGTDDAVAILLAALTLWVALQDFRVMRSPDPAAISMKASTSP